MGRRVTASSRKVIRDKVHARLKPFTLRQAQGERFQPFSADVEKMGVYRTPLLAHSPACEASLAYRALCDEIIFELRPR